ncbi:hypothetical protein [Mesorhizobium wenxiniae]|uniref:Uncharacterized protein n=1 Tax=Mesorhizobium wenxiniae TaxID=2014805 RepID=A0A271KFE6_9HYPH|nr:hypothetical protein [Mesorhizobium wenxiniae]PAP94531.1 hypothetical protein CIT31_16155 [Mesorhizobium wenxiniae]
MPIVHYQEDQNPFAKPALNTYGGIDYTKTTEYIASQQQFAAQRAFDDKLVLIIAGAALLVVIFFGRWFLRFLREMVLNSAAKSVRAKRAMSGKVESLKREIVSRADANRKPLA